MKLTNTSKDSRITVFADSTIYSKSTILKCLYWYGDKFSISLTTYNSTTYEIVLSPLPTSQINSEDMAFYMAKLERDLVDFSLREIVTEETKVIRELLIAKAFANGDFDELPLGELTDPVGFDIKNI